MNEANYSKASGPARRSDPWADDAQPWDFEYVYREGKHADGTPWRHIAGLNYRSPTGSVGHIPFRKPSLWASLPGHDWHWNGNIEKPTLSPSIHHVGHWHGHLVNGVFKSC